MEDDGSMDTVDTLDGTVFMDTRSVPVLGQAFLAQKAIICHDVLQLPENVFRRKTLAAEFEIKRVIFIPTPNGVIELGASVAPDKPKNICSAPVVLRESPAMLTSFENARILSNIFSATNPSQIARRVTENEFIELRKSLSWNLLLSMGTLGRSMTLTRESPILEEPDASVVISEDHPRAQDIYIILVGTFGTYKVSEAGNLVLIMKSPAGSMIGAEDVWAERPRSVQLQCLSDEGLVLALSREAVKRLELCTSPFVGPRESEEFIDFMKREMSLNMVITASTFSNPEA